LFLFFTWRFQAVENHSVAGKGIVVNISDQMKTFMKTFMKTPKKIIYHQNKFCEV